MGCDAAGWLLAPGGQLCVVSVLMHHRKRRKSPFQPSVFSLLLPEYVGRELRFPRYQLRRSKLQFVHPCNLCTSSGLSLLALTAQVILLTQSGNKTVLGDIKHLFTR